MKNKELFAQFLEEPSREKLRELLEYQTGEYNELDFKRTLPKPSYLAKHLIAIANYGGGCLIAGIEEKEEGLIPVGLEESIDKSDVLKQIEKFIPKSLLSAIDIIDYEYKETEYAELKGKKFRVILVPYLQKYIPFMPLVDGDGIKKTRIYTRKNYSTDEAGYDDIQMMLNQRVETGYSTSNEMELEAHLTQLKTLYGEIQQYITIRKSGTESVFDELAPSILNLTNRLFGESESVKNSNYPSESYEEFIANSIKKKKRRIALELDILS